jgi:hypothetical protein
MSVPDTDSPTKSPTQSISSVLEYSDMAEQDDETKQREESEDVNFKVPPSIKKWIDGREKWTCATTQAFNDWKESMRSTGNESVAHIIDDSGSTGGLAGKQDIALNLSMVKSSADLRIIENDSVSQSDTQTMTVGWMSSYQIWKLLDIPVVTETSGTRESVLTGLESRRDPSFPDGLAYYYSFAGLKKRTAERNRKFSSNAEKVATEDEANDA